MEQFKFLYKQAYTINPEEILENKYPSLQALGRRFIMAEQVESRNDREFFKYLVFEDKLAAIEHAEDTPQEKRLFHEVILESMKQKLKFDIDGAYDKIMAITDNKFVDVFGGDEIDKTNEINETTELTFQQRSQKILNIILSAIKDTFLAVYGQEIGRLIITENVYVDENDKDGMKNIKDKPKEKFSYHIITRDYCVANNREAYNFTVEVMKSIPNFIKEAKIIDEGVNKKTQNFRMLGSRKIKNARVKKIADVSVNIPAAVFADTLITNVDSCELLPTKCANAAAAGHENQPLPDDHERVMRIFHAAGLSQSFIYRRTIGTLYVFTRTGPSHCDLCNETHHTDNQMYITTYRRDTTTFVYRHCRHAPKGTKVLMGNFLNDFAPGVETVANEDQHQAAVNKPEVMNWADRRLLDYITTLKNDKPLFPQKSLFDILESKNIYSEDKLRPFEFLEEGSILCVKAAMKMGKTKALRDYLNAHFASALNPAIIRFVSFRQTFSSNIKEKFPEFVLYSDIRGDLNQDKLIIQVESLDRIKISAGCEAPDLVILDECESIIEQFDSGNCRNFTASFATFAWMIRYAKRIVAMDAGIGDRTYKVLAYLRGLDTFKQNAFYHCNNFKNATRDTYFMTNNIGKWHATLFSSLSAGERVAIPLNSLKQAEATYGEIIKRFPNKKIAMYSSETPNSIKKEHFANVSTAWGDLDVLIYTPTVSAGVSFEVKWYDKVFGYFTDCSCNVETSIQMIGRIRDVDTHKFFICMQTLGNCLPVDTEIIKRNIVASRENLSRKFDANWFTYTVGVDGDFEYQFCDYFAVYVENERVRNISRNVFTKRFLHYISETGANVEFFTDEVFEDYNDMDIILRDKVINSDEDRAKIITDYINEIAASNRATKDEVLVKKADDIAAAQEIEPEEAKKISAQMNQQQDVSRDEFNAFEKWRLRKDYKYTGVMDKYWVIKYSPQNVRQIHRNIAFLRRFDQTSQGIDSALKSIQYDEHGVYVGNVAIGDDGLAYDLNRRYMFDKHRIACGLLRACGWDHVRDRRYLSAAMFVDALRQGERYIMDNMSMICVEFEIRKLNTSIVYDERLYLDRMVRFINRILSVMYGCKIKQSKKDQMYFLTHEYPEAWA